MLCINAHIRSEQMSIMLELNHPHIIKLLDFFEKKDSYYMVVEKANGQFNCDKRSCVLDV